MKKIIGRASAVSAGELIRQLQEMVSDARFAARTGKPNEESVYVTINSDSVRLVLVEEILTDGSTVYNIELKEASK